MIEDRESFDLRDLKRLLLFKQHVREVTDGDDKFKMLLTKEAFSAQYHNARCNLHAMVSPGRLEMLPKIV